MKRRVAAQLPAGAAGRTLLEYLSSRFTYHTREEWAKRISEGELSLNGTLCNDSGRILQAGFVLEYAPKVLIEPEVRRWWQINPAICRCIRQDPISIIHYGHFCRKKAAAMCILSTGSTAKHPVC